jgi:hypothetical protein
LLQNKEEKPNCNKEAMIFEKMIDESNNNNNKKRGAKMIIMAAVRSRSKEPFLRRQCHLRCFREKQRHGTVIRLILPPVQQMVVGVNPPFHAIDRAPTLYSSPQ